MEIRLPENHWLFKCPTKVRREIATELLSLGFMAFMANEKTNEIEQKLSVIQDEIRELRQVIENKEFAEKASTRLKEENGEGDFMAKTVNNIFEAFDIG